MHVWACVCMCACVCVCVSVHVSVPVHVCAPFLQQHLCSQLARRLLYSQQTNIFRDGPQEETGIGVGSHAAHTATASATRRYLDFDVPSCSAALPLRGRRAHTAFNTRTETHTPHTFKLKATQHKLDDSVSSLTSVVEAQPLRLQCSRD